MAKADQGDTQDRRRMSHAYESIRAARADLKKISARSQGLPIEVRSQGLAVTVATLIKENRADSRLLADWLAGWLLEGARIAGDPIQDATRMQLLERATTCKRDEYLALQAEALAYLEHIKRLLSAFDQGQRS